MGTALFFIALYCHKELKTFIWIKCLTFYSHLILEILVQMFYYHPSVKSASFDTVPANTCSNSAMETLEKGLRYVQLTINKTERRQCRRSGVFIVNIFHISCFTSFF